MALIICGEPAMNNEKQMPRKPIVQGADSQTY